MSKALLELSCRKSSIFSRADFSRDVLRCLGRSWHPAVEPCPWRLRLPLGRFATLACGGIAGLLRGYPNMVIFLREARKASEHQIQDLICLVATSRSQRLSALYLKAMHCCRLSRFLIAPNLVTWWVAPGSSLNGGPEILCSGS